MAPCLFLKVMTMSKIGSKILEHYWPVKHGQMVRLAMLREISSLIDTLKANSQFGMLIHMGLFKKAP